MNPKKKKYPYFSFNILQIRGYVPHGRVLNPPQHGAVSPSSSACYISSLESCRNHLSTQIHLSSWDSHTLRLLAPDNRTQKAVVTSLGIKVSIIVNKSESAGLKTIYSFSLNLTLQSFFFFFTTASLFNKP